MYKASRIAIPILAIVLVDAIAFMTRNTTVLGGIPLAFLIAPCAVLFGILTLVITSASARQKGASLPPLPGNIQVMGAGDSMAVAIYVLKMVANKEIDQDELKQDFDKLEAYLNKSAKQDQKWQLRLAIITTAIGLIGGWMPSILITHVVGK